MKHLEEQSATWWKKRFQAVVSLWVCSDTKNRCYINRQAHILSKIMKRVIKKKSKASTITTEEARGVALFDGKREEKMKGRGRYLERER